jgi:hypothetical protein
MPERMPVFHGIACLPLRGADGSWSSSADADRGSPGGALMGDWGSSTRSARNYFVRVACNDHPAPLRQTVARRWINKAQQHRDTSSDAAKTGLSLPSEEGGRPCSQNSNSLISTGEVL